MVGLSFVIDLEGINLEPWIGLTGSPVVQFCLILSSEVDLQSEARYEVRKQTLCYFEVKYDYYTAFPFGIIPLQRDQTTFTT